MRRVLILAMMLAVTGAVHAIGNAASQAAPVRCGTGWLKSEHAAGRMTLPRAMAPGAAKRTQDTTIEVGTELLFAVSGRGLMAAVCQRVGEHSYVFVENRHWDTNGGSVLQSHVDKLGELFDASSPADPSRGVYELETEAFGDPADVDGDGRIFLLVLNVSSPDIVGYFDPAVATHDIPEYRRDVLFLDETFLRRNSQLSLGTLAHEFQHLIHWHHDNDEEPWIDEGLSGYAEELVGYPEADPEAVPEFLKRPHTSLTDWNFLDSARHYGVTYLFSSYLAEVYGPGLIRELVAHPRNGTAGLDAAFAARNLTDRFLDVWQQWMVGNYASKDERYGYGALGERQAANIDTVRTLPLQDAAGAISGRYGSAAILFRTPGDVFVDFVGDSIGRYSVWTYAMHSAGAELQQVAIDADNHGVAQLTGIDSVVVIVGRTSQQGLNFQLSARAFTPTVIAETSSVLPAVAMLGPAFPNPFNSSVRIPYAIADAGDVGVTVFDLLGRQVRILASGWHVPGRYEVTWDGLDGVGRSVASGVYLTRLQVAGRERVSTLALIR
jgi:hypothetical protein